MPSDVNKANWLAQLVSAKHSVDSAIYSATHERADVAVKMIDVSISDLRRARDGLTR